MVCATPPIPINKSPRTRYHTLLSAIYWRSPLSGNIYPAGLLSHRVAAIRRVLVMIRIRTLALAAFFLVFWPPYISANDSVLERWPEDGHIRVLDPSNLTPDEAEKIYDALLDRMVAGYLKSGLNEMDYRAWMRLNTTP